MSIFNLGKRFVTRNTKMLAEHLKRQVPNLRHSIDTHERSDGLWTGIIIGYGVSRGAVFGDYEVEFECGANETFFCEVPEDAVVVLNPETDEI